LLPFKISPSLPLSTSPSAFESSFPQTFTFYLSSLWLLNHISNIDTLISIQLISILYWSWWLSPSTFSPGSCHFGEKSIKLFFSLYLRSSLNQLISHLFLIIILLFLVLESAHTTFHCLILLYYFSLLDLIYLSLSVLSKDNSHHGKAAFSLKQNLFVIFLHILYLTCCYFFLKFWF
jgi:hypothetical protein